MNLWDHQTKAIELAKDLPEFALFFEMGTGKTRTTIELLRYHYNQKDRIMRTLILCPIIVTQNWKQEFLKFSKIPEKEIVILDGSKQNRIKKLSTNARIFVMNFEGLIMDDLFEALKEWCPEILVCDESHRLKNISAKRTKRAIELSDKTIYRYLLSGTPVLNTPTDIFAQFRILDGGATFGKNFFSFRGHYFYDRNAGMPKQKYFPDWKIKQGALEKMNQLIYRKAMRVKKEECLSLPPLVKQTIFVEMDPVQEKLYAQMKKDFITFVQHAGKMEAAVAQLAITKALRLLQIVSGFVRTEDGNDVRISDTPKVLALKSLLEDLVGEHKILVWAVFKENYEQIRAVCRDLGVDFVEVHGDIPNKDKFDAVERFNSDPRVRVFIGHPGSGGIGLNLVAGSYSIFYSRNFSLEQDLQAEARNYRGGSECHARITRIDLVCQDTIDQLVRTALDNKIEIGEKMLLDLAAQL